MRFLTDARRISSSASVAVVLAALRSLLVLRFLGPSAAGVWKAVMILYPVGGFARMGVSTGMSLRVPVLNGQGDDEEADRCAQAAGFFLLVLGLALGAGIFVYSFFVRDPQFRLALRFMALLVFVSQPHQYLRELASARRLFHLRSREILIAAAADFASGIALAWCFGLAGIGAATVLGAFIPAAYLWHGQHLRLNTHFDWTRIRALVRVGFPYSMTDSGFTAIRFVDVLVMTPVLGPTMVGYYAVSSLITDFSVYLTQLGVNEVVAPHMLREYGRLGSHEQVAVFYELPARFFCYVLPPILAIGTLLIPSFVHLALPQYTPGIAAAQITMWGIFFMAVHASVRSFLAAAEKINLILKCFAVLLPLSAAAQFLVIKAGYGLEGVACTAVTTLAILTSTELYIARRGCGHNRRAIAGYLLSLYFPLGAAFGLTVLIRSLDFSGDVPALAEVAAKVLVGLLLYVPVFLLYESHYSLLKMARRSV